MCCDREDQAHHLERDEWAAADAGCRIDIRIPEKSQMKSAAPPTVLRYRFECPRCLDSVYGTGELAARTECSKIAVECGRCGISYAGRLDIAAGRRSLVFTVITEIEHG